MSSFAKWSRRSKSGKDDHMNRKINAAITAGLSLSMVLGSTPVTAIAAQPQQLAAKSATEANVEYATVTFYDEGDQPIGDATYQVGSFNWGAITPDPKDGKVFRGWKFTGDTDDHTIDFSKTAMPDADVCLQAVWQKNAEPTPEPTENEHTVTIYENGKVSTVKVKDGEKLSKPADPEAVAGYEFVGWSTSKSEMAQYDFDQPVTDDLTIYAMFNAKKETVENGKAEDSKKQVAADKKNEAKAEKKDAAALPTTGDPIFVVTSAASLAGAVAAAVGMYMTKRREH